MANRNGVRTVDVGSAVPLWGPLSWLEPLLLPCDRLRRWVFQRLGARFNRFFIVPRARRVIAGATVAVVVAAMLTLTVPLWMIAIGPLLLGMPHVLADLRYLVLRPRLHRQKWAWLIAVVLLFGAVTGNGISVGLVAAAIVLVTLPGTTTRKAMGLGVVASLWVIRWRFPVQTQALMIHLHNAIAVFFWWLWRREKSRLYWLPLALFAVMSGAILLGLFDTWIFASGLHQAPATHLDFRVLQWELGGFAAPQLASRLVLLYAFGQGVHYTVWLRLLPEEDRQQPTPRSFRRSYRALVADVGPWLVLVTVVGTLGFVGWGVYNAAVARHRYLQLASLHVDLELVAMAALWLSPRSSVTQDVPRVNPRTPRAQAVSGS